MTSKDSPENNVCTPEHCFYAFDALFCALTYAKPVVVQFKDEA
jgi:AMME syndrome candidate gene 1 protein